jgi:ribonuclease VapC
VIVDSSAVIAILLREPGWDDLVTKLGTAEGHAIGGPTLAECGLVLTAKIGRNARPLLSRFVHESRLAVIPFGEEHWRAAVDAYHRVGKGRHRAALNFGDCLSYATARLAGQPLLCVGDDFARTDLTLG